MRNESIANWEIWLTVMITMIFRNDYHDFSNGPQLAILIFSRFDFHCSCEFFNSWLVVKTDT